MRRYVGGAKSKTATTRRLTFNTLGVKHEFTEIDSIRHRARLDRACRTRARAEQTHRRHRHADQVLGALDRRRQQHREGAEGARLQRRPAICRRRYSEPALADREHGDQGRQGAGHRFDRRHHALRCAQAGQGQGHHRDRLRPADPRHAQRRLLCDLRQLPGRRAAGAVDRAGTEAEGRQGPVQHRAVRRLA